MPMLVGTGAMRSAVPGSPPTILSACGGSRTKSLTTPFSSSVSAGVFAMAVSGVSRSRAPAPRKQMRATADSRSDKEDRQGPFFHYTNEEGADGINESGTLRPTEEVDMIDAAGGEGIYVTDLDPWQNSKSDILENNYGTETDDKDRNR
ncbi:unnamed protein product [Symbiodinium natans]|uniref:Uncharacterized protein n=1 Tax=Symbiodinium natans TaxID=878477 RepID=A0A812RYG4_9DINO|nr:unnamed protein product [Symbiodinium natans]